MVNIDEKPQDAEAEEARAKAQARREKIMAQANNRMDLVSGGVAEEEEAAAREARIKAMRRRRFKKTTKKEETEEVKEPAKLEEEPVKTAEPAVAPAGKEEEDAKTSAGKKYMGVAKKRRQMIKEKQQEAAAAATAETSTSTQAPIPLKAPIHRLPIIFHIVTTLLLFLAGLDIGLNQMVDVDVNIHRVLATEQYGVGILNREAAHPPKPDPLLTPTDDDAATTIDGKQDDEFSPEEGDDDAEYIPNIDPLFQVDLDVLTAGEGVLMFLARGAVAAHRLLLRLVYYLPLSILSSLLVLPQKLVENPPILALTSLALRQGSKWVMGAQLPDASSGKEKSKDVLDMIKSTVLGFVMNSFPTVVTLYSTFNMLRSDMYVILCGVLVGLVLMHHPDDEHVAKDVGGGDEL